MRNYTKINEINEHGPKCMKIVRNARKSMKMYEISRKTLKMRFFCQVSMYQHVFYSSKGSEGGPGNFAGMGWDWFSPNFPKYKIPRPL